MAESSLLRLLILVMYFLCSLSNGQSQTVTCDYNRSSLIPGQFLSVNITGQPCRGGAIRTLRFCFLEADSNLTQIRYRLLTNITQLSFPPPYTGFIGTVTLCGNLNSLCCSMASIGDFNSIIYFQVIAFDFIGGQEYLKTNFQSLQLSVLTTESASLSTSPVHESTSLSRTQFSTFFEDSTRISTVLSSNQQYIYVGIGVLVFIVIALGAIILVLMMYMKIKHKQVVATDGDSSHHRESLVLENDKSSVIMTDNDEEYSSPYNDRILTEANVAYTSAMENLYEECGPPTRKVDYSNTDRLQESHCSSFSGSYHNYY